MQSMPISPRAQTAKQIEDARCTLDTVRQLIEHEWRQFDPRSPNIRERYHCCVYWLAFRSIKNADKKLFDAEMASIDNNGLAAVDNEVLDILRPFRSIGSRKLADLLHDILTRRSPKNRDCPP